CGTRLGPRGLRVRSESQQEQAPDDCGCETGRLFHRPRSLAFAPRRPPAYHSPLPGGDGMPASLATDLKTLVKGAVADDDAAREAKSTDFGRMLRRVPGVVVRPASADDVAAVLRYARKHAVPVATRGEAHTQTGQSLTDGGILLDLTSLDRIHRVEAQGP